MDRAGGTQERLGALLSATEQIPQSALEHPQMTPVRTPEKKGRRPALRCDARWRLASQHGETLTIVYMAQSHVCICRRRSYTVLYR
jgi:hypothetical protein